MTALGIPPDVAEALGAGLLVLAVAWALAGLMAWAIVRLDRRGGRG